jgi:hypothetical protein
MRNTPHNGEFDDFMHRSKMDGRLAALLVEEHLLKFHESDEEWFGIEHGLADAYMISLATVLRERLEYPLLSDWGRNSEMGEYLSHADPHSKEDHVGEDHVGSITAMFRLKVPFPSAKYMADVTIKDILGFRRDSAPERLRLRETLENLMKGASKLTDQNALREYVNSKQKELDLAIREHRKAIPKFYAGEIPSVMMLISAPVLTNGVAQKLVQHLHSERFEAITTVGAVTAVLTYGWWSKFKTNQANFRNHPYYYLVSLKDTYITEV